MGPNNEYSLGSFCHGCDEITLKTRPRHLGKCWCAVAPDYVFGQFALCERRQYRYQRRPYISRQRLLNICAGIEGFASRAICTDDRVLRQQDVMISDFSICREMTAFPIRFSKELGFDQVICTIFFKNHAVLLLSDRFAIRPQNPRGQNNRAVLIFCNNLASSPPEDWLSIASTIQKFVITLQILNRDRTTSGCNHCPGFKAGHDRPDRSKITWRRAFNIHICYAATRVIIRAVIG